jgi:hypothetical protein
VQFPRAGYYPSPRQSRGEIASFSIWTGVCSDDRTFILLGFGSPEIR